MFGPGAYRPAPTEGMTALADLPQPEIVLSSRNEKRQPCPRCRHAAYRDKQSQRTLHDLGNLDVWCPRDLVVTYSQHYCTKCQIPPDLVVKSQAIDIVEVILSRIRRPHIIHT